MLVVNFKKLHSEAKLPVKGSSSAACFDVYATSVELDQNYIVTYGLGFATEIPEGWRAVVVPRSNISKHPWVLANSVGIIDSDYRGEWLVKFKAITDEVTLPYTVGERIAQVYFERVTDVAFAEVEELDQTERGEGGFGSTGLGEVKPNYVTSSTASIKSFNE